jgi:lipopolysaccharide export LptBFGC system permease protein LptF
VIIDRHIMRRFLENFAVLFSLLFVFASSIDVILQLERYLAAARSAAGAEGGALAGAASFVRIVLNFHGPRVFQLYTYLVGLVSIGAMGFTLAHMHRHRELVAVMASGVSLYRLVMPFVIAAFGLNAIQLLNQELILPRVAPLLIRRHGDLGRSSVTAFEVPFTSDGAGTLFQSPSFDPRTRTLRAPLILERDELGRTVRRITAASARWDESVAAWRLEEGLALRQGTGAVAGGPTAGDAARAVPVAREPVELVASDLTPHALTMRRYRQYASMLNLRQIGQLLDTPGVVDADSLRRYRYSRFASVLVNLLVLAVTLPFFLLREPASLLRQSLLCAATALPAMLMALLLMTVKLPGISPALGVFLPVLVLIPVVLARLTTIRT